MKFGFVIYPGIQLMDIVGPLEVINIWKMLDKRIEVYFIAEAPEAVDCGSNFLLQITTTFASAPQMDYLIVPGGMGRLNEVNNTLLTQFIQAQFVNCQGIAAVCTGAFLLEAAGILRGHEVTTYWRALPELSHHQEIKISEKRIAKSGKIWTCGGISSGIDLALALIADIAGENTAGEVQLMFEYFPSNQVYCRNSDLSKLPPYPREIDPESRKLPIYMRDFINN